MFRFSIRDVLWLTVLVSLAAGWYVEHRRQQARIDALDKQVQQMQAAEAERLITFSLYIAK